MELKLNSWYVWLWNYTYSEEVPNNLCPLFWKLVVAILLFIPNLIFRIPVNIYNMFAKKNYDKIDTARTGLGIAGYILIIAIVFVIWCLYNFILYSFNFYSYNYNAVVYGGVIIFVALFLIIRYYWLKYKTANKIIDVGKTIKEKTSNNIVINYTKSWYNNNCPKINWK